jgi:GNAT superfamily N-acetyltransferase
MEYCVKYNLKLRIPGKFYQKAINIFNHLHSDEMLTKYARGGVFPQKTPVSQYYWYTWVSNPSVPYTSLIEAFDNWHIVDPTRQYYFSPRTKNFILSGEYSGKLGQQDFLIEQLAPVLDNMCVQVEGEDNVVNVWIVDRHRYRKIQWYNIPLDSDNESDSSEYTTDDDSSSSCGSDSEDSGLGEGSVNIDEIENEQIYNIIVKEETIVDFGHDFIRENHTQTTFDHPLMISVIGQQIKEFTQDELVQLKQVIEKESDRHIVNMTTSLFSPEILLTQDRIIDGILFRPLDINDYQKGFCDVLASLTTCGTQHGQFIERFNELKSQQTCYIIVGTDTETNRIVAAGTVFIECKFIHMCGMVGHIEDIVIAPEARGKHLGKILIMHLTHIAQQFGCYKVILDCADNVKPFYEKCGYQVKGVEMAHYF